MGKLTVLSHNTFPRYAPFPGGLTPSFQAPIWTRNYFSFARQESTRSENRQQGLLAGRLQVIS